MCEKRKSSCRSPTHIVLCRPQGLLRGDRVLARPSVCVCDSVSIVCSREEKKKPSVHILQWSRVVKKKKVKCRPSGAKSQRGQKEKRGDVCGMFTSDFRRADKIENRKKKIRNEEKKGPAIGANARRCNSTAG